MGCINVKIIGCSPVGHEWRDDQSILNKIKKADLIIINGEGTLHSGREEAERLLQAAVLFPEKRVILLNALYENNPPEWKKYLEKFDIIGLRDPISYETCSALVGKAKCHLTSDLSLYSASDFVEAPDKRQGIAIGDSVKKNIHRDLYSLYLKNKSENVYYLPIKSLNKYPLGVDLGFAKSISQVRYRLKQTLKMYLDRNVVYYNSHNDFYEGLHGYEGYITGRFHGVCLSIKSMTPFVAVSSNTGKIERLLKSVGLEGRVLNKVDQTAFKKIKPYTDEEKNKIRTFIRESNDQWRRFITDAFQLERPL